MSLYSQLFLRETGSPYGDITRNSTLSFKDLDQNFIFLKERDINQLRVDGSNLIYETLGGTEYSVNIGGTATGDTNTFVTGFTFNSPSLYKLTISQNEGEPPLTVDLSSLASDVYVLSGAYDPSTGDVEFTNSTGGTFVVSGFTTGMTDSYTDAATLNGNTIEFDNNIQGSNFYNVDLTPVISGFTTGNTLQETLDTGSIATGISTLVKIVTSNQLDLTSTDGGSNFAYLRTVNNNDLTFSAANASAGGEISLNPTLSYFKYNNTSGEQQASFNGTAMTITDTINTKGLEYNADYSTNFVNESLITKRYVDNSVSGKVSTTLFNTYTGDTETVLGTKVSTASNIGGGEGLFSGKSGTDLQFKSLTSTGGTVTISTTGATVNLESAADSNFYVTGFTYNDANTLIISRNGGLGDLSATINTLTGLTIDGVLSASTYTGITLTSLDDVTSNIPSTPDNTYQGRLLYFDATDNQWLTGEEYVSTGNVTIWAKKGSAGTIDKGCPVYITGFDNDIHEVELANASTGSTMPVIGFTAEDFDNAGVYPLITFGKLAGIDTTSATTVVNPSGETWEVNDVLYMAKTDGGLTKFRPSGTNTEIQRVAKVLNVGTTDGQIFVFNTARTAGLPNLTTDYVWLGNGNDTPQEVIKTDLGVSVTGFSYDNNNTFTITDDNSGAYTATINQVSGLTVDGTLTLNNVGGTTPVTNLGIDSSGNVVSGTTGGDVSKVGTPVNNQIGVWTGDGTLEGDTGLTWNTAQIEVTDTDNNLTEIRADWLRVYNETDDANLFLYGYGTGHRGEIVLGAANGDRTTPTATLNGNNVATISAFGHSGTGFRQGGHISFAATENYTEGTNYGTRFVIQTVADGSTSLVTRYATDGDGNHDFTGDVSITGDVGIGTTIPQEKLHVSTGNDLNSGNISFLIGGTAGTNARTGRIIKNTSSPYEMTIRASDFGTGNNLILNDTGGNVGIGTTSPTEALDVSGNTVMSGTLNIGTIGGTTSVTNLGIDASGNVVSGSTGGGSVSFGSNTQIPFTNGTSDDFDYTTGFTYNGSTLYSQSTASNSPGIRVDRTTGSNNTKIFGGSLSGTLDSIDWSLNRAGVTAMVLQTTNNTGVILGTNNTGALGTGQVFHLRSTGNIDIGQGYNDSAIGARVGIKGEGTTSGTSSLKTTDSGGTTTFEVKDDGTINIPNIGSTTSVTNLGVDASGNVVSGTTGGGGGSGLNYISAGAVATNLENTSNWDINGVYTGATATGSQADCHVDSNYWFTCVATDTWIRLIRG